MQSTVALFLLLFLATFLLRVDGHGVQCFPPSRGLQNTQSVLQSLPRRADLRRNILRVKSMKSDGMEADNCPHCLNSGGKGAVVRASKGNWTPYEPLNKKIRFRRDSGLCGDPITMRRPRDHEAGGKYYYRSPITATYKQGSVVEFIADLTTNHQGYFEYFMCDAVKCGGDINEACFKKGHCHQLMREKTPVCESAKSKECAPVDPAYPGRWYIGCRKGGHVGEHFVGGKYMRYHLPKGFTTKHAVLQWYWVTANSCNPPGFIDYFKNYPMHAWGKCGGDGGTIGGRNPTIATCGGKVFPEEFWNCADVEVNSSGRVSAVHVIHDAGGRIGDDDDDRTEDLVEKKGSANKKPAMNQPKSNPVGRTKRAQPMSQNPHRALRIHRHKKSHGPAHQKHGNRRHHVNQNKKRRMHSSRPHQKKNNNKHRAHHHSRRNRWKAKRGNKKIHRGHHGRPWRNNNKRHRYNRWMAKRRWNRRFMWRRKRRHQWRMKRRNVRVSQRRRNVRWQWRSKRRNALRARRLRQRRRNMRNVWRRRRQSRRREKAWGSKNGKRCVLNWNQCGGIFYSGPHNCCKQNYKCVRINRYYSHCKWGRWR